MKLKDIRYHKGKSICCNIVDFRALTCKSIKNFIGLQSLNHKKWTTYKPNGVHISQINAAYHTEVNPKYSQISYICSSVNKASCILLWNREQSMKAEIVISDIRTVKTVSKTNWTINSQLLTHLSRTLAPL